MATPSEILRKEKVKGADDDTAKSSDDKGKKDKGTKRNALIDFIAKHKKAEK